MEEESHLGVRAPPLDPDVAALALLRVSHMRILVSSGTRAGADPPPSGGEGGSPPPWPELTRHCRLQGHIQEEEEEMWSGGKRIA